MRDFIADIRASPAVCNFPVDGIEQFGGPVQFGLDIRSESDRHRAQVKAQANSLNL